MQRNSSKKTILAGVILATSALTSSPILSQAILENSNSSSQFSQNNSRQITIRRVNVSSGDGVFSPAIEVALPDGGFEYVKLGEQGLTREIFFDDTLLKSLFSQLYDTDSISDVSISTPPPSSPDPAAAPATTPTPAPAPTPAPLPVVCTNPCGCFT